MPKIRICPNTNPSFYNLSLPVISTAASMTASDTNSTIVASATNGAVTINLPDAKTCSGAIYIVKKADSSTNAVVIDGYESQTIDGSATLSLTAQNAVKMIQSDGSNWIVISSS